MKARSSCRCGFTMVAVVLLITLVGGVITLMTFNASYFYRSHKLERSRCVLLAITEIAVSYTRAHRDAWRKSPPGEPIVLNMKALMPADAEC